MMRTGGTPQEEDLDQRINELVEKGDAITLEFNVMQEENQMQQRRLNTRHKELMTQFQRKELPCHKDLLELSHEQINLDHDIRERLEQLYQRERLLREEAIEELQHRRRRLREIIRQELQELVQKKKENPERPRINSITPTACPIVKREKEKVPTFKAPPHPKVKSEAAPTVVIKAPPPKLSDDEDVGIPPPRPPEVPHPSEIPREYEVPQLKRIMTPERKTYVGTKEGQRAERKLSREPSRQRSEPLPPIPEQEVIPPSPKKAAPVLRDERAPPPPKLSDEEDVGISPPPPPEVPQPSEIPREYEVP